VVQLAIGVFIMLSPYFCCTFILWLIFCGIR